MNASLQRLFRRLKRKSRTTLATLKGADAVYQARLHNEREQFDQCFNVHGLPDIFHYWSNRYLLPMFQLFGFTSPNDFFLKRVMQRCRLAAPSPVAVVSVGAGNCDLEIDIAEQLAAADLNNASIDCIEINGNMIDRAMARLEGSPAADLMDRSTPSSGSGAATGHFRTTLFPI